MKNTTKAALTAVIILSLGVSTFSTYLAINSIFGSSFEMQVLEIVLSVCLLMVAFILQTSPYLRLWKVLAILSLSAFGCLTTAFMFHQNMVANDPAIISGLSATAHRPYLTLLADNEAKLTETVKKNAETWHDCQQRLEALQEGRIRVSRWQRARVMQAAVENAQKAKYRLDAVEKDFQKFLQDKAALVELIRNTSWKESGAIHSSFIARGIVPPSNLIANTAALNEASFITYLKRLRSSPTDLEIASITIAAVIELVALIAWVLTLQIRHYGKNGDSLVFQVIHYASQWGMSFKKALYDARNKRREDWAEIIRRHNPLKFTPFVPKNRIRAGYWYKDLKDGLCRASQTKQQLEELPNICSSAMQRITSLMMKHELRMAERLRHVLEVRADLIGLVGDKALRDVVERHTLRWVREMGGLPRQPPVGRSEQEVDNVN